MLTKDIRNIIGKYLLPDKSIIKNNYILCLKDLKYNTQSINYLLSFNHYKITKIYRNLPNYWNCDIQRK